MPRISWCKMIWNGRSKGVSTVIGTVFLMLTIVMVATSLFIWGFSRNAEYNAAVREMNQEEADRRNENVVASNGSYSVDGDEVTVKADLMNAGSVATQIVNIWVFDTTTQKYSFNNTFGSPNVNLDPGDKKKISVVVTISEAGKSHVFNSWFVTSRGNAVPLEIEQDVSEYVETHEWIDLGTLRFHFSHDSLNFTSENHHNPSPGWVVPGDEKLMFHVEIVNTGRVPITLKKHCCFYLMEYMELVGSSQKAWSFYIVDPDSLYPDSRMYPYDEEGDPYVIQPNAEGKWWLGGLPVTVKFGSYKVGDKVGGKLSSDPDVPYLVFIGLFYEYEEDGKEYKFGQTIPFVAIRSMRSYNPG